MSNLTQELKELKNNIANYSSEKYEEYSESLNKAISNQKERMSQASEDTKNDARSMMDDVEAKYNEYKNAASEKKQELYNSVVDHLSKLNDKIDNKTDK